MFNKLKQIKDLRDQAKKMQEVLEKETVEGSADWGKVKVRLNGNMQMVGLDLDPSVVGDKARLEKEIPLAFADAAKKIQGVLMARMKEMGGMPGLGDLMNGGAE